MEKSSLFYIEEEFKDTEIGRIPKEWDIIKLGDIASIVMGQSPPSSTYNNDGIGLPFLQGKMEFGNIYPSPLIYCSEPIKIAEANYVLMSVRAPVGDVNLAPYKLCIGRGLAALRFNNKIADYLFYFYYLQRIKAFLEALGKGSTFKAITKEDLENLKAPFLTLNEQNSIASILSVIDEAIQKTDEVIAKTERLKKGMMQELLTKGIGHKEFKDTEIGRIPNEWEVVKLEDVSFDFIGGGTPSTSNPDYWNGHIAWMTSAHINGRIITSGQRYITKEGLENSATHLIPKDNLLIATRVGIGKVAINKIDIAISQDLTGAIIDKDKVLPDFLYWVIVNNERRLKSIAQGSTIKGILREDLGRLLIPKPPFSEQQQIASILSVIDRKLELERNEKSRLERIKKGFMNKLLTGKIRVRVEN